MSSTTDRTRRRRGQDGQVLAIFAFGIIGILAIAALVFDIGQNLFERRREQDAADASALAGARWLVTASCKAHASAANCPEAVTAARALATTHGYASSQVTVNIPPTSGQFAGLPGHIQVGIDANRGSYFAGVLGITAFKISASAVAANVNSFPLPYSLLSLNASGCKAGWAHGNGTLTVQGDILVDSTCTQPGSFVVNGTGASMTVSGNCGTAGSINAGTGTMTCASTTVPAPVVADPLAGLQPPAIGSTAAPYPPANPVVTGTGSNTPPNGCPGSSSIGTAASPKVCDVNFNRDKVVWIYPGVYYGGLKIRQTSSALTVYMAPGIYYMAGGGFEISGQPTVYTVDAATVTTPYPTTYGGGILIYNTDNPSSKTGIKTIDFQNTQNVQLHGYTGPTYTGMLIWQDRNASSQPAMGIEGSSTMKLKGTIYIPKADFIFTGNGGTEVLDAQVVCDEFEMGGNGNVSITYDPNDAIRISGIGLVQ